MPRSAARADPRRRARLERLLGRDGFVWAAGIEDTFVATPRAPTGRTLDAYALTDHYRQWRGDLDRLAELGVRAARWGVPWHRVNPAPRRWDWSWVDRVLARFAEVGVEPIVDLVHYGTPLWLEGAFLHESFAARAAEYAARLAERARGVARWYTPVNEPRITAWYCGRLGWWPPARRTMRGFAQVLVATCRGMAEIARAVRAADPDAGLVHADATDLYASAHPALAGRVRERQALVFLALDLVTGRVGDGHPLRGWLAAHGVGDAAVAALAERAIDFDVIGLNVYPMFSRKILVPTPRGVRIRMPYAGPDVVSRLARAYWRRYRRPVMITETASWGSTARRAAWLRASVDAVGRDRRRGVPVVGYTWFPAFGLVGWAYREGRRPIDAYVVQMGLWDLRLQGGRARRIRTSLVDAYRALTAAGVAPVGGPLAGAA